MTIKTFTTILILLICCQISIATGQSVHNPGVRLFHEATGLYQAEHYSRAFEKYEKSSSWGNKLSQFNIGTMYYNGIGRSQDRARAWAWIALSAERGYPQLVAARQEIRSELDQADRRRAERIYQSELLPAYGDEKVLPRVRRYMDRRYRSATGSRRGGAPGSNSLLIHPRNDLKSSGEVYYDESDWSVDQWLEQERSWFQQLMEDGEPLVQFEHER